MHSKGLNAEAKLGISRLSVGWIQRHKCMEGKKKKGMG
jgi:hypothetical protein